MRLRTKPLLAGSATLVAVAIAYWCWDASTKTALAAALERCRAAGLPLTVDDIRPPSVPDADNAAPVLDKLEPLMKALPAPAGSSSFREALMDFEQAHPTPKFDVAGTKELTALLDNPPVREVVVMIHQAITKPAYDAHLDYGKGPALVFDGSTFYDPARLLYGQAQLAALRGQTDEACAEVWNMTLLAEMLGKEPILVPQLSRCGIWHMALDEMEKLAATGAMPISWNQRFSERLEKLDLTEAFARSLDGERVTVGQILFARMQRNIETLERFAPATDVHLLSLFGFRLWLNLERYRIPGVIRLEEADYIDLMREVRGLIAQEGLGFQEVDRRIKATAGAVSPDRLLLKPLADVFGSLDTTLWKMRARIDCAKVGLALERYRQTKGEYPATLAALVPDYLPKVSLDIFTNQPLIYRTEPGGAVVSSVGPNLRDDGGMNDKTTDKDDHSWFAGAAAARKYAPPAAPPAPSSP